MPNDDSGKAKLIEFIKEIVRGDLEEIRKEHQGFKETVKSLVAEQLNLMSIIIRHHDCITQLQKGQTHLKKKLKAAQAGKDSEAEPEERGNTAFREGSEKLKQILGQNNDGGDHCSNANDESFEEILNAVEQILDKSREGVEKQEKDKGDQQKLQSIPSSMHVWAQQTYGDKDSVLSLPTYKSASPRDNLSDQTPPIRPITTTLKNATTFESLPVQEHKSSSSRVPVAKSSLLKKESVLKSPGSLNISRAGQESSMSNSQQSVLAVTRPGTYSRKKVKAKKEKLAKVANVERIRTAVPPMPPLNFERLNHLQSLEGMQHSATRRDPGHIHLVPLGSSPKVKSRFPPIHNPQASKPAPQLRGSLGAKVIGPKISSKEMSLMSHWNQSKVRQDLYPSAASSTVIRKPAARKLPSPRTRIREHFLSLKKKK